MSVIGLDVGTTGCKAIVFSDKAEVLSHGFREYEVISEKHGYNEQDSEYVWKKSKEAMLEAIKKSGINDIAAICTSVQGDAIIPIDENGMSLYPAILGMDYRSLEESELCCNLFGEQELFELTGMRSHPMNSLTKIMWLKKNEPEIYKKADKIVTYADFLLIKMGAPAVIDETMASRTMMFDLKERCWSRKILDAVEISQEKLSKPVKSGIIVGKLRKALSEELGLTTQPLLVSGGHDQTCAALGAGVICENMALDSHGTAEVISAAFCSPRLTPQMYNSYYPCYCHAKVDMYFTFTLNHVGGILLKWFRDNFCEKQIEQAQALDGNTFKLLESKTVDLPSEVMILPHFNGSGTPLCDLKSKGAIVGLTLATTKYDIVKAIMDSLTYELRINLQALEECGVHVDTLRAVGGAAKSDIWMQIKADITGKKVQTLMVSDAPCLGAAMLAFVSIGQFCSLEQAVNECVKIKHTYTPRHQMYELYNKKYEIYKTLYDALKQINHKL